MLLIVGAALFWNILLKKEADTEIGDEEKTPSEKLFPRVDRLSRFGRGAFVSEISRQLSRLYSFDISLQRMSQDH